MQKIDVRKLLLPIALAALTAMAAAPAFADSVDIVIPASVSFNVTDVTADTSAAPDPFTITFTDTSLALGNKLRVGVRANAADFSSPAGETSPMPESLISWTVSNATGVTGSPGTLSTSDTEVLLSGADPTSGSADIAFTLAAPGATGLRAGTHALTVTWSLESL